MCFAAGQELDRDIKRQAEAVGADGEEPFGSVSASDHLDAESDKA